MWCGHVQTSGRTLSRLTTLTDGMVTVIEVIGIGPVDANGEVPAVIDSAVKAADQFGIRR